VTAHADPVVDSGLELRFGRMSAGAAIRDRLAYRDSTYEVGYYDERLWTDKPEAYVKRALAHALFDVDAACGKCSPGSARPSRSISSRSRDPRARARRSRRAHLRGL